jgi:exopolysaccharide production protein ExoZ
MTKKIINSFQVFRGLAALAVLVHHAAISTSAFVGAVPDAWLRLFDLGALGVDFFFVLSGFIIMHAHMPEGGKAAAIKPYLIKRLARIFPAYWPIGLTMLVLYLTMPGLSSSAGREFSYLSSILLLPTDLPPALSVAWTLVHELLFYAVFMLWFVSRRVFWLGLLLWALGIFVTQSSGGVTGWLRYPLNLLNLEFMLGVLVALLHGRVSLRFHTGMFIAGGSVIVCTMLLTMYFGFALGHRLGLALGLSLLMLGMARREQHREFTWPISLLALGNASYSIYLIHNPLVSVTQRVVGRFEVIWPLALLFGVVVSVGLGYLYFLWVERPLLRWVRAWSKPGLIEARR